MMGRGMQHQMARGQATESATFGAGCFWGVEVAFANVPGVKSTTVGYAGGTLADPTYHDVCRGDTGHTEVVRVTFDPAVLPFEKLLEAFWSCHDPTQRNRQGPDVGFQYRSVIFYENDDQAATAREAKERLEASNGASRPIATAIEPAGTFYRAEEYHQQYLAKRGMAACHV